MMIIHSKSDGAGGNWRTAAGNGAPCGNIVLTVAVLGILITAPLGALAIDATHKRLLNRQ